MLDLYSKIVLTIIAVALVSIAAENYVVSATAQRAACGNNSLDACYVTGTIRIDGPVEVSIR